MDDTIRLIIVDDHDLVRETWKMVLESDPRIEVIAECASGAEAIQCASDFDPDVMLIDINMTPMNGFETTREIAKSFPDIKIIGISINNQTAYARTMLQLGAKGFVTKNSPREEMLKAILTVVDGGTYICNDIRERMPQEEN